MVDYRVVEKHADHAEVKGFTVVRRERYRDSEHVAHARKYPERYWEVVRESCERELGAGTERWCINFRGKIRRSRH